MTLVRRRAKSFVWVALLAMCGLVFGPSISRALAGSARAGSGVAHAGCPDMGAQMHAAAMSSDGGSPAGGKKAPTDPTDCCGLCAVAASPLASPSFPVPAWVAAEMAEVSRPDFSSARPAQRVVWLSATPRGPPSIS